jgi:hypothetical protein
MKAIKNLLIYRTLGGRNMTITEKNHVKELYALGVS